jgi:hypothetical protein
MEPVERPAKPPTPRQEELIRIIQGLDPASRHTLKIVCRGTEPWEIQEIVEHRALGELRPRRDS